MRQRFAMQPIRSPDEYSPAVAEKSAIVRTTSCSRRQVRNNDDIEFQALRLMHAQDADHLVFLADDLRFGFSNARVLRTVTQVSVDVIERCCSLTGQTARDFDEFANVGDALPAVLLHRDNDIQVDLADDGLEDCSGGG